MRIAIVGFSFLLLLVIDSSSLAQLVPPAESRADIAFQRALNHYHSGKLNEAAGLLRGFIVSQSDSKQTEQAYYYLALIHRDLGNPSLALDYLDRIPQTMSDPAILLLHSQLSIQKGNPVNVVDLLAADNQVVWPLELLQQRNLILAESLQSLNEPQRALYFLYQAMLVEGKETPREVLSRIYPLLSDHFNNTDLSEVAFMYRNSPVSYLAMLQMGWRALADGQKDLAHEWATAALSAPVGFAYHEEVLALQAQLTDQTQQQRSIGVLLPLSGRYAAFGERVQRGMELAMNEFRPHIPVRFIFRDTAGDETAAAQQVAELAISDRVMGIAGPLVGNAAYGAVARARRERIPILTMSQRDGLAASSNYVFRNSLTPQLQIKALLDHAIEEVGYSTFGILYPKTRQGEHFADLFRNEVWLRGAEIVSEESYETSQTDFRHQVRLLQGLDPNAPDEEEQELDPDDPESLFEQEEEPPPFEALFIPDYADRINLIVPQVAFYGLENIQLLGTNGWNDKDLPRLARQFAEDAIFTDSFFVHSPYAFVQDFVKNYIEHYNEEPTILEAQGYDTAAIILSLLNDPRVQTREDLRQALSHLENFPGVTGATRFDPIGEADKVLFLLQIRDGVIVQIN